MIGKFIGETSMGFTTGKTYLLKSKTQTIYKNGFPMVCICLYDEKSSAWCPYSSLETILENWEFMPVLRKQKS